MAKRRLSQQQKKRIRQSQAQQGDSDEHRHGRVISHQGGQVLVELPDDDLVECRINLGQLVCGDRVAVETTAQQVQRVIAILPRENLLQRVDGFGQVRAVAANISQLIVTLAISPEPNLYLLDQYLVSAEQQQINACILLNKIDLAEGEPDPFQLRRIYAPLEYPVIHSSVKSGAGMDEFRALLPGQVSVLGGVSGVGKSSLTSWLLPDENIRIARISSANEEGRHTTRASRLYALPSGGELIDTPGVRGFSPFVDDSRPLAHGFREIRDQAAGCRFHNCLHLNEPRCAVIDAVEQGAIDASRYANYLKMLQQTGAG